MISMFYMRETIAGIFQTRMMIPPSKMRYQIINILMRVPLKIRLRERLNFMVAPSLETTHPCHEWHTWNMILDTRSLSLGFFDNPNMRDIVLDSSIYIKFKIFILDCFTFLWEPPEQQEDEASDGIALICWDSGT